MHRTELRIASLFVLLLAACPGDEIENPTEGATTSTGETTSDEGDTTKPTTGVDPDTTSPTGTTDPSGTSTSTTDPTGEDTGTSTSTTDPTDTDPDTTDTETATTEPELCGNGGIDDGEACDGALLMDKTCQTEGFDGGALACDADCAALDISGCTLASCGNGSVEGIEVCDGADLLGEDCVSQGFDSGDLACADNCGEFNTDACIKCGNDKIDGADVCDGADLAGADCVSEGFEGGDLACALDCSGLDNSGCFKCGDDLINGADVCDGTDLAGADCVSEGFDGGDLACAMDCSAVTTDACFKCGDGAINGAEVCDGDALDGATCVTAGFTAGTIDCKVDCSGLDTTACSTCGNSTIEGAEMCDGLDVGGATCVSKGLDFGYISCENACGVIGTGNCIDAVDESEPNDDTMVAVGTNDFSVANADGPYTTTTTIGGMITLGDDDIYAITNPSNTAALVTIETFGPNGPGTCPNTLMFDTYIELRSAANGLLGTDDESGINHCSKITNYSLAANTTVYLRVIDYQDNAAIADKYYVTVDIVVPTCGDGFLGGAETCDDGNLVANDGCSATCTAETTAEIEPNNTIVQADATGLTAPGKARYNGAITPIADVDRYRVEAVAPKMVRFETFSKIGDCTGITTNMRLFNPGGTQIAADIDGLGISTCAALTYPVPMGASYIQVEETGNNALVPAYLLDIVPLTDRGAESEPNDTIATADINLLSGTDIWLAGDHSVDTDLDYYAIQVPYHSSLRLEIIEGDPATETCESNGIDAQLFLYNAAGEEIATDDDAGRGFCSLIDGTGNTPLTAGAHNMAPGTYYLQVRGAIGALDTPAKQFKYRLAATVRKP